MIKIGDYIEGGYLLGLIKRWRAYALSLTIEQAMAGEYAQVMASVEKAEEYLRSKSN